MLRIVGLAIRLGYTVARADLTVLVHPLWKLSKGKSTLSMVVVDGKRIAHTR